MKPYQAAASWSDKVTTEKARLGRPLTLDELLKLAKTYNMNAKEIETQRQQWALMKD